MNSEAECYICAGISHVQSLRLVLLSRMLKILNPMSETEINDLLEYGKCFACAGSTLGEILELTMLEQIADQLNQLLEN
jgi:hypothetical protein